MKKKVIIEKFNRKYECIVRNGPFPGEVEIKVSEILYPNRKFFKGGVFNYKTFIRDIEGYETIDEAITSCLCAYRAQEIDFEIMQKKLNDFFETP